MDAKAEKQLASEKPLTPLQAAFVRWYTTPGPTLFNGTASAREAGYKGSEKQLAVQASQNLRKPNIHAAINRIIDEQFGAVDLTIGKVLRDIEMTRMLAIAEGDYSTALRCSVQHGKHLKMWIDKVEHVITMDDMDLDDLYTLANRLASKVDGFDFGVATGADGAGPGSDDGAPGDRTTH